ERGRFATRRRGYSTIVFERPPVVVVDLPPEERSPGQARRAVANVLGSEMDGHFVADAALLTSEIVTNAAMIGCGCRLSAWYAPEHGRLRVEVLDHSPEMPVVAPTRDATDISGRGLQLVQAIADRWGVDPIDGGKYIWFELHHDPAQRPPETSK